MMLRIFTGSPPRSLASTLRWFLDPRPRPASVGKRHDHDDLVRPWRIRHHHSQGIELIECPDVILVTERNVDGVSDRANFDIGRNDRQAAADSSPHRLPQPRMEESRSVLDVAGGPNDRRLAIGNRWMRQQWQTFTNQPLAKLATKHDELLDVILGAARQWVGNHCTRSDARDRLVSLQPAFEVNYILDDGQSADFHSRPQHTIEVTAQDQLCLIRRQRIADKIDRIGLAQRKWGVTPKHDPFDRHNFSNVAQDSGLEANAVEIQAFEIVADGHFQGLLQLRVCVHFSLHTGAQAWAESP